jgi:hypothetical protein
MTQGDVPEADLEEQSLPPREPNESEILEEVDDLIEDAPVNEADALEQRLPR